MLLMLLRNSVGDGRVGDAWRTIGYFLATAVLLIYSFSQTNFSDVVGLSDAITDC